MLHFVLMSLLLRLLLVWLLLCSCLLLMIVRRESVHRLVLLMVPCLLRRSSSLRLKFGRGLLPGLVYMSTTKSWRSLQWIRRGAWMRGNSSWQRLLSRPRDLVALRLGETLLRDLLR